MILALALATQLSVTQSNPAEWYQPFTRSKGIEYFSCPTGYIAVQTGRSVFITTNDGDIMPVPDIKCAKAADLIDGTWK